MRYFLIGLAMIAAFSVQAQVDSVAESSDLIHYFRVNAGPKIEQYSVSNGCNVRALPLIDVGGGIYIGRRFTKNFYAEVGLNKNDYAARFEITTLSSSGEELRSYSNRVYPTYSTLQLGLLGGYRRLLSPTWTIYGQAGVQFFLTKKLDREGSQQTIEVARSSSSSYDESIEVITFSNGFESGNMIFRADVGAFRKISKTLDIDVSISGRFSNLPISEFEIEYKSASFSSPRREKFINKGLGLGLNFGVKYRINHLK